MHSLVIGRGWPGRNGETKMAHFEFVDANGKRVSSEDTQGYFFRDFFDCDIGTATAEDLSTYYRGPDCDGIGVRWTAE